MNYRTIPFILAATAALADTVVELDPYTVSAAALRAGGLPAGRSLLGDGAAAARSASVIDAALLHDFGVSRVEQLMLFVPGAVTPARFGVLTVPDIRGDAAEICWNGQRGSGNQFGYRPTFNAVEAVEVLSGPGTVAQGPGKKTGGLVNFVTKRADAAATFSRIDLVAGSWLPGGGSFRNARLRIDHNQPLAAATAVRLSIEAQDSQTLYRRNGGRDDHLDLFLALSQDFAGGARLDLWTRHLRQESPQLPGVNRPWQGLVDAGRYFPGGVQEQPGGLDPGLITATGADLVRIDKTDTLLSVGDYGSTRLWQGQALWRSRPGAAWQLDQRVYADYVDRAKENAFLYLEDVRQLSVEARSELRWEGAGRIGPQTFGVALRLEERRNYTNYWNEFAWAYDITAARRFDARADFAGWFAPGARPGPGGEPYYSPSSGIFSTPETVHARVRQAALFHTGDWKPAAGWTLRGGWRIDRYWADATDPLPEPGTAAWHDRLALYSGGASLQLLRDLRGAGEVWIAAVRMRALAGNTVGDGVNLYADGRMRKDDFRNRGDLFELGWQAALAGGRLHSRLSAYQQERTQLGFFGSNDIRARGVEWAWQARPSPRWRLWGNVAWQQIHFLASAPAEFGGSALGNMYAPGAGPDGAGNGLGYLLGFFLNSAGPDDYRLPGVPRWTVQSGLTRDLGGGWRAHAWGWWRSRQPGNLRQEYWLPQAHEVNLTVDWSDGRRQWAVSVLNLTDQTVWLHNGDTYFDNILIGRNLPLRLETRFSLRF